MYLFFDTETSGLPRNWNAPASDLENWPRLVQLAWIQYDSSGNEISGKNRIIKPEGFEIPFSSTMIHGITNKRALETGIPLQKALNEFLQAVNTSNLLVAHNMNFDEKVISSELIRTGKNLPSINKFCTMETTADFCKIPHRNGYKWPKLTELHKKLFNSNFNGAHDASNDVLACARCFFELKNRGIIE